ncbi:hypothetical protein VMT65_26290 [Nocardia sp. CDC153]|uniref:hypothetical protein n=1 Tax=Nocardia sp. CDC153 TaxID=3112167 RepID=UPI002DBFE3CD|nr:hypothetical protein [Nocardia sp. CDC153]MEC3956571.1 hypothetical protein [Nocardia sp. CDC153]
MCARRKTSTAAPTGIDAADGDLDARERLLGVDRNNNQAREFGRYFAVVEVAEARNEHGLSFNAACGDSQAVHRSVREEAEYQRLTQIISESR